MRFIGGTIAHRRPGVRFLKEALSISAGPRREAESLYQHVDTKTPSSSDSSGQSDLRALSAGVKDPKAIGFRRISINDLDWRPSPLPNADAWRAGKLDLPAGAFDDNARPGFGRARPVRAVRTQHIGEDGDRVVALEGDELCEISPFLIEKFKHERIKTPTKNGTPRAHASVNREFETLSRLFNLAIAFKKAESNPCSRVKKFKLDNERYRYLLPEEEPVLLKVLTGKREHLKGMITVALGLGLRKREQLHLRRDQVDFSRDVVVATKTKGRKNREIPMDVLNPEVREILLNVCSGKKPDDYVFENPETGKPFTDIKRSFHTACRMARIEGLWWHDLRATFCTRLALAGYEALTIMTLMGHKDLKTTMRYIRAVQLQKNVRSQSFGLKSPTQEIRPPVLAAVSC